MELDDEELDGPPSKTARKRDAARLRALGDALTRLAESSRERLDLPPEIADAIADYQRFPTREARRRQLSRLGKLLRAADPEHIDTVESRLAELDVGTGREVRRQHMAEQWRDRMLGDAGEINAFIAEFPHADRNRLRALVRRAAKDRGVFRQLYRELLGAVQAGEDDDT